MKVTLEEMPPFNADSLLPNVPDAYDKIMEMLSKATTRAEVAMTMALSKRLDLSGIQRQSLAEMSMIQDAYLKTKEKR